MNKQIGFTLIEVAIVMVIIGLMLTSLLGPLGNRMEQAKIESTGQQIDDIIEAIHGFAAINGRLPCPANLVAGPNLGLENINVATGICIPNTGLGQPPWVTLGTNQLDAWGQVFVYRVDPSFANNVLDGATTAFTGGGCVPTNSTTSSFSLCSIGNITITTGTGGLPINSFVAQTVPAIIVSRGKIKGAVHADETENIDNDVNFVSRDMRPETAPAPFNDIVRWIPTNVLVGKMVQAQRLP